MTQRKTSTRRRAAAVALATAATLGLAGMTAGTAQAQEAAAPTAAPAKTAKTAAAESFGFFTASGVNIRTGPSTGNTSLGQGQAGQTITIHCTGNPWWYITNRATGVTGWVYWPNNVLISHDSPQPPNC